jgi:hypothetical protein
MVEQQTDETRSDKATAGMPMQPVLMVVVLHPGCLLPILILEDVIEIKVKISQIINSYSNQLPTGDSHTSIPLKTHTPAH